MASTEVTEIVVRVPDPPTQEEQPKNPILSLFSPLLCFISKLLPKPQQQGKSEPEKSGSTGEVVKRIDGEEGSRSNTKVEVVKFPKRQPEVPPLKLENEEAEKDTNPIVLWQVYALGGFIILKWAWSKWQERKANAKNDDEPSNEDQPTAEDEPSANEPPADS